MRYIHAEFGFEIGLQLSANSSVTLPYPRDKEALLLQPDSTRDNQNVISLLKTEFSWSANLKKTFLIASYKGVAIATKY